MAFSYIRYYFGQSQRLWNLFNCFSILDKGTGSYPPLNNGLHFNILFIVKKDAFKKALGIDVTEIYKPVGCNECHTVIITISVQK